jgi:hypothetical protein
LEQLIDSELSAQDSERARRHIAECLFCLTAYSELLAASPRLTTSEVAAASRPAHAVERLEQSVVEFLTEAEQLRQHLRHRALQRQYSEPSLLSVDPAIWPEEHKLGSELGPKTEGIDRELSAQLDVVERALRERLTEVRLLKDLVARGRELRKSIYGSQLPSPTRKELLRRIDSSLSPIVELVARAVALIRHR